MPAPLSGSQPPSGGFDSGLGSNLGVRWGQLGTLWGGDENGEMGT